MKKMLLAAILCCLPMFLFANSEEKEVGEQSVSVISDEILKEKVKNELDSLLSDVKTGLEANVKRKFLKSLYDHIDVDSTQFFYDPNNMQAFTRTTIKFTHKQLSEEDYKNKFTYSPVYVTSVVKLEDKNVYSASASFETRNIVRTMADSLLSDVRYKVDMQIELKIGEKKVFLRDENNKRTGEVRIEYPVQSFKVNSCEVSPIDYLTSEDNSARAKAKKAILNWYAETLPTLDMNAIVKDADDWKFVAGDVDGLVINGTYPNYTCDGPEFKVSTDWTNHISASERNLYDNTVATRTIAPEFTVTVAENAEPNLSVSSYDVATVKEPVSIAQREELLKNATSVKSDFVERLMAYASNSDEADALLNMFDPAANYEVSYKFKSGKVQSKKYNGNIKKYLKLLAAKKATLEIVDEGAPVFDPNMSTIIYTIKQTFNSKTYSDITLKKVVLTLTDGMYVITEVSVDSTERIENK